MLYRLLISTLIAVAVATLSLHYVFASQHPHAFSAPARVLEDGARGPNYPIRLVIATPLDIHDEAIRRGLIKKGAKNSMGKPIIVVGLAQYNDDLTFCLIWVPPLSLTTMWVWIHEIKHCNAGPFHRGSDV